MAELSSLKVCVKIENADDVLRLAEALNQLPAITDDLISEITRRVIRRMNEAMRDSAEAAPIEI